MENEVENECSYEDVEKTIVEINKTVEALKLSLHEIESFLQAKKEDETGK